MSHDDLPLGDPLGWAPAEEPIPPGEAGPAPAPAPVPDPVVPTVPEVAAGADGDPIPAGPAGTTDDGPLWPAADVPAADAPLWPAAGRPPSAPSAAGLTGSASPAPGGAVGPEGWVAAQPGPRTGRRFPRGLIIGLVVIVVVIAVGVIGRDFLSGNVSDLRVGDCFDDPVAAGGTATEVEHVQHHPCSEPHQFEVFASFEFPGDRAAPFPGDSGFDTFVNDHCDPAFTAFVGIAEADSSLTWVAYQPLEAGWTTGDREITCFLQDRNLDKLTGSVQGTAR